MSARMQELLGLLAMVVERVRAANERAAGAEARSAKLAALLDAMQAENASLREELDEADEAAAQAQDALRTSRERAEAAERVAAILEERATEAELRIHRAAAALGLPAAGSTAEDEDEQASALH